MSTMLRATGYSVAALYGAMSLASGAASSGVFHVLAHLQEHHLLHKAGHKLGHGKAAKYADAHYTALVERFPVLKKLTGPTMAGMVLYGFAHAPLHTLEDWDLSNVKKAFDGQMTPSQFLQTGECVSLAAGIVSGKMLNPMEIAKDVGTMTLALTATAILHSQNPKLAGLKDKVRGVLGAFRPKKSLLEDLPVDPASLGSEVAATTATLVARHNAEVPGTAMAPAPATQNPAAPSDPTTSPQPDGGVPIQDTDPAPEEERNSDPKADPGDKKNPEGKSPEDGEKARQDSEWWKSMSEAQQKHYLAEHPNSIYAA
jgi:hypothetical protein